MDGTLACPPSPILFRHRKRTETDNLSLLCWACWPTMASFWSSSAKICQATRPPHFLKSSAGLEENYYAALRRHSFRKRLLLRYTMASFQSSSAKIGQARPPAGGRAGGRGGLWHRPASSRSGRVATGACQLRLATVLHVLGLQRASKQQQPLRRDLILCSFNGLFLSRPDIYENTYLYYNYVFLCLLYSLFTFR